MLGVAKHAGAGLGGFFVVDLEIATAASCW